MHWLHHLKVDPTSIGLCGTSTIMAVWLGNGLQWLTAISIITTIVYNIIRTIKEYKK